MTSIVSRLALAALSLGVAALTGCAAVSPAEDHQSHQHEAPSPALSAPPSAKKSDMPGMEQRMKAMQEMCEKMAAAKTPAERDALMAEHMKSMQSMMQMMMMDKPNEPSPHSH